MILFDVPTIPLLRRVKLTSIAGSAICACEAEIDAVSATAAPAILAICPSPMTHVPSFALRAHAQTHRVKTKPVTKDANEASGVSPASHAECRGRSPSRPSHRHCRHRCERPLRMDTPSTGWVTALAGLLARGSLPC